MKTVTHAARAANPTPSPSPSPSPSPTPTPTPTPNQVTHAELELVTIAAAQARRFVEEERWRVAADGIVLNLSNGALLTRAQRKVPLLKTIERGS